jgi:hypothetical protein
MSSTFSFYFLSKKDADMIEYERKNLVSDPDEEPTHEIGNVKLRTGSWQGHPAVFVEDPEGNLWSFISGDDKLGTVDYDHGIPLGEFPGELD